MVLAAGNGEVPSSRRLRACVPSPPFCRGGAPRRVPVDRPTVSVFPDSVLKAQEALGVVIEDLIDVLGRQA